MLSPVSDSIGEEIDEEIGLSTSLAASKVKTRSEGKKAAAVESSSIAMQIDGFESSKMQ